MGRLLGGVLAGLVLGATLVAADAAIEAVVLNEQGQPIAGARVRLLNASTGYRAVRYTNALGQFHFEDVPFAAGYLLTTEALGFGVVVREDLTVALPGTLTLAPLVLPETQHRFGTFWLERPSSQWTEEEALHLATDSPWARPAMIRSAGELHVLPPERSLRVQWLSSRAVRSALGHLRHLPRDESEALLARPLPDYHLFLFAQMRASEASYDYSPLAGFEISEERLQQEVYLELLPSGERLHPTTVVPVYGPGQELIGVNFFFVRVPIRAGQDQTATLVIPQGDTPVQVRFDFEQMQFRGRLDL